VQVADETKTGETRTVLTEHEPTEVIPIADRNGVVTDYVLGEAEDLEGWLRSADRRRKLDKQGRLAEFDSKGFREELISQCLKYPDGRPVPATVVQGWGPRVKAILFDKCQDKCGLSDEARDREGKG